MKKKKAHIFVVSDASGFTAERVIHTILAQFKHQLDPVIRRRAFVREVEQLQKVLEEAGAVRAVVIYSLVCTELLQHLAQQADSMDIMCIDLLGPLIETVSDRYQVTPAMLPGLLQPLNVESFKLAEAIDYTLSHDDGRNLETLGQADVIIMGVSRTSKTPTSLYLACNYCMKVANVPIILGMDLPKKLFTYKRPRLVGLTIRRERLITIRRQRFLDTDVPGYMDNHTIARELTYSHELFARFQNILVVDISDNTIEETATRIMR